MWGREHPQQPGNYPWIRDLTVERAKHDDGVSFARILANNWPLIEADLQDAGVDVAVALDARSWRWLKCRITGLLSKPPSTIVPIPVDDEGRERLTPIYATRLQTALQPDPTAA